MFKNNKGLTPVVATSLLLVVGVLAIVSFDNWYSVFSSSLFADVETQSSISFDVGIDRLIGESLYVKAGDNLEISNVIIDGINCDINGSYSDIVSLNVSSCLNSSLITHEVVLVTSSGIVTNFLNGGINGNFNSVTTSITPLNTYFLNLLNTSYSIYPQSITQLSNGNYLVVSYNLIQKIQFRVYSSSGFLIKTSIEGGATAGFVKVQSTTDGGFILLFRDKTFDTDGDIHIIKYDSNLEIEWEKLFGTGGNEGLGSIIETKNETFLFSGTYASNSGFISKLSNNGSIDWFNRLSPSRKINELIEKNDSYIGVGSHSSNENIYIFKTDLNGNRIWMKELSNLGINNNPTIIEVENGNLIISAQTDNYGAGHYDFLVIKVDSSGNLIWSKTIGGSRYDQESLIKKINDDEYILFGESYSFGSGARGDLFISKINSSGDIQWAKYFNSGFSVSISDLLISNNNSIVISASSYQNSIYKPFLLKIGLDGDCGGCTYLTNVSISAIDQSLSITDDFSSDSFVTSFTTDYYLNRSFENTFLFNE